MRSSRRLCRTTTSNGPSAISARWQGSRTSRGRSESQEEAFAAWRGFLEGIADESPLVLVFEDLHWADEGLLDFVDHLADWATRVPLLVVGTARPELLARRPAWGGGKTNALTLSLAPLSGNETAELVHALLEQAAIPADIQATLLERAGGNPLYAEEFVRLLDERSDGAALPETVQGIIAARLDVLDREEKELLQDAAVLGRVFWVGGLARERTRRKQRSIASGDASSSSASAGAPSPARRNTRSGTRSSARSRTSRFRGRSGERSTVASPTGSRRWAGQRISPSSSRITTSPCSTTPSRTRSSPGAPLVPWARQATGRSRSMRTRRRRASTGARSKSAAPKERGQLLFGLGNALTALADAEAVDCLVEASATLVAAGDPETAAEAECFLAEIAFNTGDAPGVTTHIPPRRRARARASTLRGAGTGALAGRAIRDARRPLERGDRDRPRS